MKQSQEPKEKKEKPNIQQYHNTSSRLQGLASKASFSFSRTCSTGVATPEACAPSVFWDRCSLSLSVQPLVSSPTIDEVFSFAPDVPIEGYFCGGHFDPNQNNPPLPQIHHGCRPINRTSFLPRVSPNNPTSESLRSLHPFLSNRRARSICIHVYSTGNARRNIPCALVQQGRILDTRETYYA